MRADNLTGRARESVLREMRTGVDGRPPEKERQASGPYSLFLPFDSLRNTKREVRDHLLKLR